MANKTTIRVVAGIGGLVVTAALFAIGRDTGPEPSSAPAPDRTADTRQAPSEVPVTAVPYEPPSTAPPVPTDDVDLGGLGFVDVTAEAGLDAPQTRDDLLGRADIAANQLGGQAAAGDYDADGDLDLVLTRTGLPTLLYRNDGTGSFVDVAAQAGIDGPVADEGPATPTLADIDGDGHLDLLLAATPGTAGALHLNEGDGTFRDATTESGLDLRRDEPDLWNPVGAALADWDRDGDLDLVTLGWYANIVGAGAALGDASAEPPDSLCEPARVREPIILDDPAFGLDTVPASRLYRNDGDARFTDITADSGVRMETIIGFNPAFTDVDGDGWLDLVMTGDACTSHIYRNDGGERFVDITRDAGVGDDENGMGSTIEDIDGDGNLDWFITSIAYPTASGACPMTGSGCSGNRLYLGDGQGGYRDATDEYAVRDGFWGWGTAALDFDNDGYRDLVMANGWREDVAGESTGPDAKERFDNDPTRFWLGRAEPPWPEVSELVGLDDRANGKDLLPFDMDGDGDLDLLIANTGTAPILYRNDTPPGNHWLRLRLRQPGANPHAIGARAVVDRGDPFAPMPVEVRAGGSLWGSGPTGLHIGLGDLDRVRTIEVFWPGETEPQVLTDVAADQILEVARSG